MNFLTLSVIFFFSFQLVRFECLDKNPILKVTLPWNCLILFGNSLRNQKSKKKKKCNSQLWFKNKKMGGGVSCFPQQKVSWFFIYYLVWFLSWKKKKVCWLLCFKPLIEWPRSESDSNVPIFHHKGRLFCPFSFIFFFFFMAPILTSRLAFVVCIRVASKKSQRPSPNWPTPEEVTWTDAIT